MAAPPPALTLAVEKGPRQGETRRCRAGATLRVGRVVKGNDLAVRDKGTSQQHLAIQFLPPPDARWAVSDLGSSNGTLLNDEPLGPFVSAPLSHGDLIKVGDSTVLAVSIAYDSDPNPGPTGSSHCASEAVVPVVEKKPPVVTRRDTRKKAAVEPSDAENAKPDAAEVVVVVEEKTQVITRRGGRKKVAAAEAPGEIQGAVEVTRQRGRKKAVDEPEPEKDKEEATVATRLCRRIKATEPPEQENDEDDALVMARHGEMNEIVSVLPPKARSGRGRGRVTRASARNIVLEVDEEQQGNELAESRACTGNCLASTAVKGDEKQKGGNLGAGGGEVEGTAKALRGRVPKGRPRRQPAASGKGASVTAMEPHEDTDEAAGVVHCGWRKKAIKLPEVEKEESEKEDATVATRRGGRKKDTVMTRRSRRKLDVAVIAPPALHSTTRSRGRGRVTRASRRILVLDEDDEEEKEENEVDASRGQIRNSLLAVKDGKEKMNKVAAGAGKAHGAGNPLEEEVSMGRACGQRIARMTRASQRILVLDQNDEEKQEENEMDAPRVQIRNSLLAVKDGEEKVNKVAAGDGKAHGAANPLEEVPKGRASDQRIAFANGASAGAVEPPEEINKSAVATRRAGRKKASGAMGRGGRKNDMSMIAPAKLPVKTRPRRGRARNANLEDDKEELMGNLPRVMAGNVGQEEKGHSVAARDGESRGTAKVLDEEVSKGNGMTSAQSAGSCNGCEVGQGGAHCSSRADSGSNGIPNTTSKYREDTKLKAQYTPFDVRLDRALKKYSA